MPRYCRVCRQRESGSCRFCRPSGRPERKMASKTSYAPCAKTLFYWHGAGDVKQGGYGKAWQGNVSISPVFTAAGALKVPTHKNSKLDQLMRLMLFSSRVGDRHLIFSKAFSWYFNWFVGCLCWTFKLTDRPLEIVSALRLKYLSRMLHFLLLWRWWHCTFRDFRGLFYFFGSDWYVVCAIRLPEVKLGLLRCTGLLENNVKALLNLHAAD